MPGPPFLRCLGQPALFSPSGEPVRFRTKKHLALLVYLAVEPSKPHRRDRLAELLWPTVTTAEARHSLATALSVLRPRLGPGALETNREHVLLAKARIELDISRLESNEILATATRDVLPVAGFLEGFEIPDAPEFTLWKDRKSASLLPHIKSALVLLIDQCRRTAATKQIEHYADTMLALDELSEEAVRAKMEARAFSGDRLTALRVYEEWKAKLAEAVGAQPSSLIEGMAVRLRRRGWERTDTTDIPTVPTDQWRGRVFVGRFDEYRLLYEAWEHTRRGRGRHALVLGDSGVGKTTLVNRLVTAAGLEGAAVSRAQCYDLEREIPYAALGNLTHGMLDLPGVSATPPETLAELARYFKEVRRRFPAIPVVEESRGETARLRLTEAFHQMLEAIVEDHPVILVIDDLHLCDEASLTVLHLLIHRAADQPIMFVLVARPGELSRTPLAARLRADAQSLGIQVIHTLPLSEAECGEVLGGLLGSGRAGVDAALRRAMVRVAGGFPMMLELLVQDWEANGSQSLGLALDSMTTDFGSSGDAPELYRRVLDRMVGLLNPATRNVLDVTAVLGHRLNDLSLYQIADLGPGQVMAAMSDLVRHRILRDNGRGLEFINEFVRTAAYLEVPSPVRRALHRGIAARLIEEEAQGVQFLGLEIAWHAIRAGQTACMSTYLLKGAQEAIAQGALDAAAAALSSALPHLSTQREAAALLLAEVLQEQARWEESAAILAVECSHEQSGLAKVFSLLAELRTGTSTADRLVSAIRQLQVIVESARSHRVKLTGVSAAAQLMGDIRDRSIAQAFLDNASQLGGEDLSADDQTQLALTRAQLLYYSGQQEAASEALGDLVSVFQSKGVVNSRLSRAYAGLGAVRCYQGRYEDAKPALHAAYSVAVRIGNETQQALNAANLALCCMRLGQYGEEVEWNRIAKAGPFARFQAMQLAYYHGFTMAMLGDTGSAIRMLDDLEPRDVSSSPAWVVQAGTLFRSDILKVCGEHASALSQAKEAFAHPIPVLHAPSFAGPFARWLALTTEGTSNMAAARSIVEQIGARMEGLDVLDRVEITCALLTMGTTGTAELEDRLRRYLAGLPAAVAGQLRRLGALPSGQ